jgi:hypothetical protein
VERPGAPALRAAIAAEDLANIAPGSLTSAASTPWLRWFSIAWSPSHRTAASAPAVASNPIETW